MNPEPPKYKARVPITSQQHHIMLKQTTSVFANALNKLERDVIMAVLHVLSYHFLAEAKELHSGQPVSLPRRDIYYPTRCYSLMSKHRVSFITCLYPSGKCKFSWAKVYNVVIR
jgi:hypothetical protein